MRELAFLDEFAILAASRFCCLGSPTLVVSLCDFRWPADFLSLPSRVLTGGGAAAGLAFVNSVGSIGGFVGPYGVGAVTDATGSAQSGLFFLVIFGVYGLFMLIPVRRIILAQSRESQPAPAEDTVQGNATSASI